MKVYYLSAIAALVLLLTACESHDDPTPATGTHVSSVTAQINGLSFLSQGGATQSVNGGLDIFGGRQAGGKSSSILLSIKHFVGLTTYNIDTATSATYTENNFVFKATSGSITVTTSNPIHVAGTFAFEAVDSNATRSIENGSFDIYTQ